MEFYEDMRTTSEEDWMRDVPSDGWYEAFSLVCELERFLVELFEPADVADIRAMPTALQPDAIVFLIERDASDEYDQVDGFVDVVRERELTAQILASCSPADSGLEICQWIDNNIPVEVMPMAMEDDDSSGMVRPIQIK